MNRCRRCRTFSGTSSKVNLTSHRKNRDSRCEAEPHGRCKYLHTYGLPLMLFSCCFYRKNFFRHLLLCSGRGAAFRRGSRWLRSQPEARSGWSTGASCLYTGMIVCYKPFSFLNIDQNSFMWYNSKRIGEKYEYKSTGWFFWQYKS